MNEAEKLVRDWVADCRPLVDEIDCEELEARITALLAQQRSAEIMERRAGALKKLAE